MKALVLGSNGYLARHLVHAAKAVGWTTLTADIHPAAWDGDPAYRSCDVRQPELLKALDWDVDAVFVFTGLSGTTAGFEQYGDYIDVNEKGLVGVLEMARGVGPVGPKIIFPSSRLVYRGVAGQALREDAEKDNLTIYAVNKRAGEMYLETYRKVFGLRYTIFRICVPYADLLAGQYSYGTIGFFLSHARAGKDIPIYGDGRQRRTFTHIEDLTRQILLATVHRESDGRIFNVAGGDNLSIREAAERIAARYRVQVRATPWPARNLACESGDTVFDSTAIEALTNYACLHRLDDWLENLLVE